MNPAELVFFDGALRPASEAGFRVDDHGVLFGCGFFETFRTSGGRPHDWSRHRDRLFTACERVGIELPVTFLAWFEPALAMACRGLLDARGWAEGVFRYTITSGAPSPDGRYREPRELLSLRELPPEPPPHGIALRLLHLRRDTGEWLPRPKSVNYANAQAGLRELASRGADAADEGLFLSADGFIVETPRQNLAWLYGDEIFTPATELGCVAGTGLSWVFDQGLASRYVRARVEDIAGADAVFAVNAVRGITPVASIWDAADQNQILTFDSAVNEKVVWLRQRWMAALAATAAAR